MAVDRPHWRADQRTLLAGDCECLFDMVEALVVRAEPWTASQTLGSILRYLESEVQEVKAEISELERNADASTEKLTGELGDLMFDALLAIAVSARDHSVPPAAVYAKACEKVRRRAAYFFSNEAEKVGTLEEASQFWATAKSQEEPTPAGLSPELVAESSAAEPTQPEPAKAEVAPLDVGPLEDDELPLTLAVRSNDLQEVDALLRQGGCDVNAADVVGETALFEATAGSSADVAAVLLLHSADPNHRSLSGSVAADFAEDTGTKELLGLFSCGEATPAALEAALEALSGPIRQRVLDFWKEKSVKKAIQMRLSMTRGEPAAAAGVIP